MAAKPNKTVAGDASVEAFLNGVADEKRRADAIALNALLAEAIGAEPVMAPGPVTTGKGCVYVKDLDAIDQTSLAKLAKRAFDERNL